MQADAVVVCLLSAAPVFRRITDGPHNVNVTDGESVIINCTAYAEPEARVKWFKNGSPLHRKSISRVIVRNNFWMAYGYSLL